MKLPALLALVACGGAPLAPDAELTRLFDEDQADRDKPFAQIDWSVVGPRDEARGKRVDELVAAGRARTADDYFHAAMVHQHGATVEELQRAHDYAQQAVALDPTHHRAKWLAAASEDRVLTRQGKLQKWTTQYRCNDRGACELFPYDPAITDAQRAAAGVPSLEQAKRKATTFH